MSCRRQPDGVEDLLIAGAAAEVARERLADLVVARIRAAGEQVRRRDDEPRRAEAALDGARLDEGLLHAVQAAALGQALDGDHLVAVGLGGEHEAGADEPAVEEHRARSALPLLAGVLRAGQPEPLAQREEQALSGPDLGPRRAPLTVSSTSCRQAPLERAAGEHRAACAAVCGRPAHVVDRRGGGGDELRQRSGLLERTGDEPGDGTARPERRPDLAAPAVGDEGERGDRDHHRVPRPDLHERLRSARRRDAHRDDQLVRRGRVPLRSDEERAEGQGPAHRAGWPARPRRPRRAAAAARRRRARPFRGSRRSSRGCGSAASRPCARPRRAPGAALQAEPASPPRR